MKSQAADQKKFMAGRLIVALAIAVGVYCSIRDHREGLWLIPFVMLFGWNFAREAKEKKEEPLHIPGLRWYHVVAVSGLVVCGVIYLFQNSLR